ncbi:MAG: hypothetical protein R3C05_26890 [Pirellulaceae bacterium]
MISGDEWLESSLEGGTPGDDDPQVLQAALAQRKLDPRWLQTAIEQDDLEVVIVLGTTGCESLVEYLDGKESELAQSRSKTFEWINVLALMLRTEHPAAVDRYLEGVRVLYQRSQSHILYWIGKLAPHAIAIDRTKVEAALPTLPNAVSEELAAYLYQY